MSRFNLDRKKLKDAVGLIVESCGPNDLGAVKLHKALYYADMLSFIESGVPITGATYRKRPFGPTCDMLLNVLPEMESEGRISISESNYFGYKKKEFSSLQKTNFPTLSEREADLLRTVADWVCKGNTAKSISDFSHDIVWEMVEFGQDIPYHLAINWIPSEVSPETFEEAEQIWKECENTRPVRASDLESGSPTALRKRMHTVLR